MSTGPRGRRGCSRGGSPQSRGSGAQPQVARRRRRFFGAFLTDFHEVLLLFWDQLKPNNVWALSGAGKRTAASGVAWSGCASLRGPLCAGEALLEARTQASVALFKLGAHSATLRPEFGGPKSLRCCCAKGVGHRAQLMLRARRGARENDYPVPLLRTPTPQKLSLSCLLTQEGGHNYRVSRLAATLPTESGSPPAPQGGWPRLKSCRSRRAR